MSQIIGRVRDATTYAPIRGAVFVVDVERDLSVLCTTGDFGEFSLEWDEGYAELYLVAQGYVDRVLPVVFPKLKTTKISLFYMWVGEAGTHVPQEQ